MESENSYLPLIVEWENYLKISKKADVKDFAYWVLEKEKTASENQETELVQYFDTNTEEHDYAYKSSEAAFLVWRLNKFVRFYTRPVLTDNGLAGQDDFAILSHIDYRKTCSKSEAIEANIIDSTTGIEIIKRLINLGLISEKVNKNDKRQKLISLTKKGKELLYKVYVGFSNIQDVMAGLNIEQRELLIHILQGLNTFHTKNIESLSHNSKK